MASIAAGFLVSLLPEVTIAAEAAAAAALEFTGLDVVAAAAYQGVKTTAAKVVEKTIVRLTDDIFGEGTYQKLVDLENDLFDITKQTIDILNKQRTLDVSGTHDFAEFLANRFQSDPNNTDQFDEDQVAEEKQKLSDDILIKSSNDLSTFVIQFSSLLSVEASYNVLEDQFPDPSVLERVFKQVFYNNPTLKYLILPILRRTVNLAPPNVEEFKTIESVYNGKNIDPLKSFETPEGYNGIDELGNIITWRKEWSPKNPVPTLFPNAVYTGIHSKNNSLPAPVEIVDGQIVRRSYLDQFAFFHDYEYKTDGSFNKLADYKLIARCKNNKEKFTFAGEYDAAVLAINYFSTAGSLVRKLMGRDKIKEEDLSISKVISELPTNQIGIDNTQPSDILIKTDAAAEGNILDNIQPDEQLVTNTDQGKEEQFMLDFLDNYDINSRTSSVLTQLPEAQALRILRAFDNLTIEIL